MIELPEACTLARQLNETVRGRRVSRAQANASPHKFAWYSGDPAAYGSLLAGKTVGEARAYGSRVEMEAGDLLMCFCEGVNLRLYGSWDAAPQKHQLLLAFEDGTLLAATVAMYGGIFLGAPEVVRADAYHRKAMEAPSPLSGAFDEARFASLLDADAMKLPAKAFLAAGQRIPGLGNGVLQDILFNARIHPRRKMGALSAEERTRLYQSVRGTLRDMADHGGRDSERDLFGNPGGYAVKMGKGTVGKPCQICGHAVMKESYLGGSVYWCPGCQPT
ncbi:MAG TPA: endonuclease VIII [Candidatus Limnocylindria bacterium]|nr:endonuclease VIII [Candidatus Limnocylindria bacterium]